MDLVIRFVQRLRGSARARRIAIFREQFALDSSSRILDLGSRGGSHVAAALRGSDVPPGNVYLADIDARALAYGRDRFGFNGVLVSESGRLPFADGSFDVVFCSSVIEHVTVPKRDVWSCVSGTEFRRRAAFNRARFAEEIRRLGKGYFVQTPNKWFPIESHTWLPVVGFLPRRLLIPLLAVTNRIWLQRTAPDWDLLTSSQMQALFPESEIHRETVCGLTKSIMAIKTP